MNTNIEEMRQRFRNEYSAMEKDANDFLKHKCNYEMMTRFAVVKAYGLEKFESFIEKELHLHEQQVREDERTKNKLELLAHFSDYTVPLTMTAKEVQDEIEECFNNVINKNN